MEDREQSGKPGKEEAVDMARSFLLGGLRVKADDSGGLVGIIQRIIDDEKKSISKAIKEFMSEADTDSFLLSLLPVYFRIRYEAYAPYWLSHCKSVEDADSEVEFTYYNDLIDMYWAGAWNEWKRKGEWCVTVMLPPTKGLMIRAYREEMRGMKTKDSDYVRRNEND